MQTKGTEKPLPSTPLPGLWTIDLSGSRLRRGSTRHESIEYTDRHVTWAIVVVHS